jgi:hypothetical protein
MIHLSIPLMALSIPDRVRDAHLPHVRAGDPTLGLGFARFLGRAIMALISLSFSFFANEGISPLIPPVIMS